MYMVIWWYRKSSTIYTNGTDIKLLLVHGVMWIYASNIIVIIQHFDHSVHIFWHNSYSKYMFKMHAKRIETEQYEALREIISVHTFVVIFPVVREYELHSNLFEQLNITRVTLSSISGIWRIINADFFSSLTYLKKFILALVLCTKWCWLFLESILGNETSWFFFRYG